MFTPKIGGTRSMYSSLNTAGRGSSQRRRTSGAYTPSKKSSFSYTPGRNTNISTTSLHTSRIVEEVGQHRVETYGISLPLLVTETLALRDRRAEAGVQLDASGWAWLVCDRKLLIWRYKATQSTKAAVCYELPLPPCKVAHRASLVAVLTYPGDQHTAACVAVSPEGAIRYWSSVSQEGSFAEISSEVKGEECSALIALQSFSCILATTTSTLLVLSPAMGQNAIKCRMLRAPQSMLSGISRRMSSFIFGSIPTQAIGAPFYRILPGEMLDDQTQAFYVLTGVSLQKWALCADVEKLLYQCDVDRFVKECLGETIWDQEAAQLHSLHTWLLDMQVTRDGIVVLGAGVNPDVSNTVYYALGTLHTEGQDSPQSFLAFTLVKHTEQYQEDDGDRVKSYRLLLPDSSSSAAFLYDDKTVLCTSVSSSNQSLDRLDFHTTGDKLLGTGSCDGSALLFSNVKGLVSVKESMQMDINLAVNESLMDLSVKMDMSVVSVATPAKIEELTASNDKMTRLKAAFLLTCKGNLGQAQSIVDDLFPPGVAASTSLDQLVAGLSRAMIDDYPASDPRWAESVKLDTTSSSSSLILIHQLEDKLKAHEYLVQFLKSVSLWERLTALPIRDDVMATRLLLCEHAEKVTAAKMLREKHSDHQALVDQTIRRVLELRGENAPSNELTPQDLFYRKVSRVEEFVDCLIDNEEHMLRGDIRPRDVIKLVSDVNTLVLSMVTDALQYRQAKAMVFGEAGTTADPEPQYMPWTASDGPRGMRALLSRQHATTVQQALPNARDAQERGVVFQQLVETTDVLLGGYRAQLDSIKQSVGKTARFDQLRRKFEQERNEQIEAFVSSQQYERAASLAEKYEDFNHLIAICEATDNQDRLQRYMNQYQTKGFSENVFQWYVAKGRRGKLMTSFLASHPQLSRFLQAGENKFMSWLHDINANNFMQAHKTLYDLAMEERDSLAKKKTLLSLCKLAALATEDPPDIVHSNLEAINEDQDLLLHQEQLPMEVLESMGMDQDTMRVLQPRELVELYVGDGNQNANEYDFKKALDLLNFVDKTDPETNYEGLLLHIWSRAVLRDDWSLSTDEALESCKDTVFFKTVELVYSTGMSLAEYLPTPERILSCDELGALKDNTNFQFLLKAGYEHIHRVLT